MKEARERCAACLRFRSWAFYRRLATLFREETRQQHAGTIAMTEPAAQQAPPRGGAMHNGEAVHLLRSEHPQVYLTWGSHMPTAPDRLKLRKVVSIWPIKFTLKADYETMTRDFTYGISCKDKLLNGRFSLNMPIQRVEYRKKFALGAGAALAIAGSFSYANLRERQFDPCFGAQLEFGDFGGRGGGSAVLAGDTFDVRQKFKVARGLRLEVCGSAKFPTPAARYRMEPSTLSLGDGAFHFHVAEVNAIVKF